MWKYQHKEHQKYKGSLSTWRKTSKPEPVYAYKCHAYKKECTSNSFVALPRLHATTVNCAHELINGVWNKRGGWQYSPKLINRECWIRLGRVAKNGIINERRVSSIQNSRIIENNNVLLYKLLCWNCSSINPNLPGLSRH